MANVVGRAPATIGPRFPRLAEAVMICVKNRHRAGGENQMADGNDPRTARISGEEALALHALAPAGKLATRLTKSLATARDLSLAYSPGVAEPCLHIARNPSLAYDYTSKGNMVAVVSNGTAVLGLGNLGALAAKLQEWQ